LLVISGFTTGTIANNSLLTSPELSSIAINGDGNTLYVGGDGPGNYSSIQEAIDNASAGDTVFVYNGTYYEHVTVDKTISLIGEDHNTTIIDGNGTDDVVSIFAGGVHINGFRVQHSGNGTMADAGIEVRSDNNIIWGNSIVDNGWFGIFLNTSSNNEIGYNQVCSNGMEGLYLEKAHHNLIHHNEMFLNFHCAIVTADSCNNTIIENDMHHNHATLSLWPNSTHNEIANNTMYDHEWSGMGIWEHSNYNIIHHNTIYNNELYGITIQDAQGNIIENNVISASNDGVYMVRASETMLAQNTITDHSTGIHVSETNYVQISSNVIRGNNDGMYFSKSCYNSVIENTIEDNDWFGIWVFGSDSNQFQGNQVVDNDDIGIYVSNSSYNEIIENIIRDNDDGVYVEYASFNQIVSNSFRNDKFNAFFVASDRVHCKNTWRHNLWNRPRIAPYPIFGTMKIGLFSFVRVNFDWFPALRLQ
jgi:parallel beta-helix repeat protein